MNTSNRDEFVGLLKCAEEKGVIKNLRDEDLRDIQFESPAGQQCKIVWYKNLSTIHMQDIEIWFDEINYSTSHPAYSASLSLHHKGVQSVHIGIKRH